MYVFQCMSKIFWVEFERLHLKFHTKLKYKIFMWRRKFKSSHIWELVGVLKTTRDVELWLATMYRLVRLHYVSNFTLSRFLWISHHFRNTRRKFTDGFSNMERSKHLLDKQDNKKKNIFDHHCDVIMGAMASRITRPTIVYLAVYSGADQRKHQSSASLAFVRGIHRWPVNPPHKWPVTRKIFPFYDVIMSTPYWWKAKLKHFGKSRHYHPYVQWCGISWN